MFNKPVFTLTWCECAENHVGMQQIGTKANIGEGFSMGDLSEIYTRYSNTAEYYTFSCCPEQEEAGIVIIRNGLARLGIDHFQLFNEHMQLPLDKKAFMYGREVNKHARWNLCFADFYQQPDYSSGKGTVIPFSAIPNTNLLRQSLPLIGGYKAVNLFAEGNYYYDSSKCGIGWHGDTERRKVIGVRLGNDMDLNFRWYKNNQPHQLCSFTLKSGDIYIFSEKATGCDWKSSSKFTLRHSAGCAKYTS